MKFLKIFFLVVCLYACKREKSVKTGLEGEELPSFNLLLMDSVSQVNTGDIIQKKPLVFLLIMPGCPYCRAMTQDITDNIKTLGDVQFYIVSSSPFVQIKEYYKRYGLQKYSNIVVGRDSDAHFQRYLGAKVVPYIAVYTKERRLKEVFVGSLRPSKIREMVFR